MLDAWQQWHLERCACVSPYADTCIERRYPYVYPWEPPEEVRERELCDCSCHDRFAEGLEVGEEAGDV